MNNTKIMPGRPRLLSDQEVIELGRDCQNTQAVYYRFQFFYKAKLALLNNVGSCTGLGLSMLNRSNKVSNIMLFNNLKYYNMNRYLFSFVSNLI